jgi:hypothetical protein
MQAIHVRTKIDSETLHLPELQGLIGKPVEILIVELPPASREEFFAEAAHVPDTSEECAAQAARFRAWRQDARFERFWPAIDRYLSAEAEHPAQKSGSCEEPAA